MAHPKRDKRSVLVIDQNSTKLNLRASILRNYEVEVHTAKDLAEAGTLWTTNYYDLVMVAGQENSETVNEIMHSIRLRNPRQRIALLEGSPNYLREIAPVIAKTSPRPLARNSTPIMPPISSQWEETVRRLLTWVGNDSRHIALP